MAFLPMNAKEMRDRGWSEVDFVYVCGDSYVDHPSFGAAIITRVLEDCGYKTAFLAQPNWKNDDDFTQFGKPRLGFMVSAGNIDSMVAHYTVAKRKRHDDAYTAGGKNGRRPDRASRQIESSTSLGAAIIKSASSSIAITTRLIFSLATGSPFTSRTG